MSPELPRRRPDRDAVRPGAARATCRSRPTPRQRPSRPLAAHGRLHAPDEVLHRPGAPHPPRPGHVLPSAPRTRLIAEHRTADRARGHRRRSSSPGPTRSPCCPTARVLRARSTARRTTAACCSAPSCRSSCSRSSGCSAAVATETPRDARAHRHRPARRRAAVRHARRARSAGLVRHLARRRSRSPRVDTQAETVQVAAGSRADARAHARGAPATRCLDDGAADPLRRDRPGRRRLLAATTRRSSPTTRGPPPPSTAGSATST